MPKQIDRDREIWDTSLEQATEYALKGLELQPGDWLDSPNPQFGMETPREVARDSEGLRSVREHLERIVHGDFQ